MADPLARGREAFARQAWAEAFEHLSAQPRTALGAADCEQLAVAAHLIGHDAQSTEAWEDAHRCYEEMGDHAEAARCAFWLALSLLLRGHAAQAGGWLSRTEGMLEESGIECAATGYLLVPRLLAALDSGDAAEAKDLADRSTEIGTRFGDRDLRAFGTLGQGQGLIALGDTTAGTAKLDEVMVSVTAGEVGPITSGIVYCAVILECMGLFDLPRASEWTETLSTWCDVQPDLVPFRGQCLVHRSQLQQLAGRWPDAVVAVEAACQRLTDPPHPALGLARYQEGELHRLLGELDEAEAEYRKAIGCGHPSMPGLALLELARGNAKGAAAMIRRAVDETTSPLERPALLIAAVDILRATGDVVSARAAADELAEIAAGSSSEVLRAMAAQATGAVALGEGYPSDALTHLRRAAAVWHRLRMPYEGARAAVLIGLACAALGDRTSASLELDSARDVFTELGARPDLDHLQTLIAGLLTGGEPRRSEEERSLSAREREVLAHLAAGETNRQIATELVISEHTVSRHLEHIFAKLGVSSRAAATAYAYEHELI